MIATEEGLPMSINFFRLRTLLLLVAIAASLLAVGWWLFRDEVHLATFSCGKGRKIVVTADNFWEISRPVHYRVRVNGETVVPTTSFDYVFELRASPKYHLVTAANRDVVGVVDAMRDEKEVLVLHDFTTGESWPYQPRDVSWNTPPDDPRRWKWVEPFKRLRAENPGLRISSAIGTEEEKK
jgi:hypothetical protein